MTLLAYTSRVSLFLLFTLIIFGCHMTASAQTLDTTDQETRREQGRLTIPNLRSKPGHLSLPYHYYRRGAKARPTVFFLSGGPGLSNLKWTPPESWLENFDVVTLEYRGVGRSSITLNSRYFLHAVTTPTASMQLAEAGPVRDKIERGFRDLQQQGIALEEFSISELVDDIERLRRQLQLPHIYLVAHSFGTRVALWYQSRYRQYAAGSVLFSLNTPGGFIWYPEDTRSVWDRYRIRLAESNTDLAEQIAKVLDPERQRRKQFGFWKIRDTHALTVSFFMSFNAGTRDRALRAMADASEGNTGTWSMLALSYPLITRFSFNWADFFVKAYSTDCDLDAISKADQQATLSPFQSPSSILFSACSNYLAIHQHATEVNFTPDYRHTLVVVGEFDPSTPIERKPAALPNESFIVIKNAGHADVLYSDPSSTARWLLSTFLRSPTPPDSQQTP